MIASDIRALLGEYLALGRARYKWSDITGSKACPGYELFVSNFKKLREIDIRLAEFESKPFDDEASTVEYLRYLSSEELTTVTEQLKIDLTFLRLAG